MSSATADPETVSAPAPASSPVVPDAWDNLAGWYAFGGLHERMLEDAPPGALFAELGVFAGKSLVGLCRRADAAGKEIRVVGVDHFLGSPEFHSTHPVRVNDQPLCDAPRGILSSVAVQTLYQFGLESRVKLLVSDSATAADLFADGSVYAVVVDAGHDEVSVTRDIEAWWPKVAPGGWIGGDDYGPAFPGVMAAVDRLFPGIVVDRDSCWWAFRKEES